MNVRRDGHVSQLRTCKRTVLLPTMNERWERRGKISGMGVLDVLLVGSASEGKRGCRK